MNFDRIHMIVKGMSLYEFKRDPYFKGVRLYGIKRGPHDFERDEFI